MAKRSDHNQAEIVAALRAVGATVQDLHEVGRGCPDLVVGYGGVNYLLEVKNPEGRGERGMSTFRMTAAERRFVDGWRGQVVILTDVEQALEAIGVRSR